MCLCVLVANSCVMLYGVFGFGVVVCCVSFMIYCVRLCGLNVAFFVLACVLVFNCVLC